MLAGIVILHWTLAIGCIVVMLMKGTAYGADDYTLNDSDVPDAAKRQRETP